MQSLKYFQLTMLPSFRAEKLQPVIKLELDKPDTFLIKQTSGTLSLI